MALKETISKAVKAAFKATGDLPVCCVYTRVVPGVYDTGTNLMATAEFPITLDIPFVGLTEAEVDYFPANRNTQKGLIAGADISFVPSTLDYITIDTVRWEVKRVRRVPGDSLFIVFIQEP